MTRPSQSRARVASRLPVWVYALIALVAPPVALTLPACTSDPIPAPRPVLTGPAQAAVGRDPSQTPYHGWGAIDDAVRKGVIEHLVVATPIESIGVRFRTYRLLGPHDQPGELLVERTDEGVALTIRLGRFGEPELEAEVLSDIRRALSKSAAD